MIRNVVVGKVKDGVAPELLQQALAAIVDLHPEGCLDTRVGVDAGLREGSWSFAITCDFVDEQAYRRYDLDEEHDRIRRELFGPICEQIVRAQFRSDSPGLASR